MNPVNKKQIKEALDFIRDNHPSSEIKIHFTEGTPASEIISELMEQLYKRIKREEYLSLLKKNINLIPKDRMSILLEYLL